MNPDTMQHFEKETLRLFRKLMEGGHYARALQVLRYGQETIALCKHVVSLSRNKSFMRNKSLQTFTPPGRGEGEVYENR